MMRKLFLCSILALTVSICLFSQTLTTTAPNGTFTRDSIKFWVGSGSKETALILVLNDSKGPNALVWGYRWNGSKTYWQMFADIASEDPRFFYMGDGSTIGGFGIDVNSSGNFSVYRSDNPSEILIPNNGLLTGVGNYDYDDWIASDINDRWVSGWGNGFWFLSAMSASGQVSANNWAGASFMSFWGSGLNEDVTNSNYTAVLPPNNIVLCDKPVNLISNVSSNSILVTWTNNNPTKECILYYKESSEQTFTNSVFVNNDTCNILQLLPQTEYNITIRSLCSLGDTSDYSDTLTFTTLPLPCTSPSGISINPLYDNAQINWINNNLTNNSILYYKKSSEQIYNSILINTNSYLLTQLTPNTSYDISLRNICSIGDTSDYSYNTTFQTLDYLCLKPMGVFVDSITANSAIITCNDTNLISWEISFDRNNIINSTSSQYLLNNLIPQTEYTIYIRKICDYGYYSEWDSITFTTLNNSNLNVLSKEKISFMLYPNPANSYVYLLIEGESKYFNVEINNINSKKILTTSIFSNIESKIDISNLPMGLYFIRVFNNEFSKVDKLIIR